MPNEPMWALGCTERKFRAAYRGHAPMGRRLVDQLAAQAAGSLRLGEAVEVKLARKR